jgi:2'-hydroxyisoflavone reductase
MKLLVLGGTQFVGRAIVEAALEQGHEVTVFHRGRHAAEFSGEVGVLHGDRAGDLAALRGHRWDAVIDTSGYVYGHVLASAKLLAGAVEQYTFVSTISVYADFGERGITEESRLHAPDERDQQWTGKTYGPMKVACEKAVREVLPERHLIVRPGIIVGPGDYTDRFPYWCRRVAEGGDVLCPDDPQRPAQWIDARDLGAWMVRMTTEQRTGTFNATGPGVPATLLGMLEGIRRATESDAEFTWVPEDFLRQQGSEPGRDFPFHVPEEGAGVFAVDSRRAIEAGLTYRPFDDTVRDTLAWDRQRPDSERKAGISRAREAELLRAWTLTSPASARSAPGGA